MDVGLSVVNIVRGLAGLSVPVSIFLSFVYYWRVRSLGRAWLYAMLTPFLSISASMILESYTAHGYLDPFAVVVMFYMAIFSAIWATIACGIYSFFARKNRSASQREQDTRDE